jgi:hypothetical protein
MIYCIIYFILIFAIGEILLNFTFFPYLKKYFEIESKSGGESEKSFLGIQCVNI